MEMEIKDAMATLAMGVNLSRKWEDCADENDFSEKFRFETMRELFEETLKKLSPLVGGYVPGNLNK